MPTNKMRLLKRMDSSKSYELLQMAKELARVATEVQDTLESSFLREQIIEVVEAHYDVGKVIDTYEIFGGYVNRSFKVIVEKQGEIRNYFLRKYKFGITENEILFEHAMITHTKENGFNLLAGLIESREQTTFVSPVISKNKFAMYQFLEGEDKYTWDNPLMEESEYKSSGEVLATFHSAVRDFDPRGLGRVEPEILELVDGLTDEFKSYAERDRNTKFHEYFTSNIKEIVSAIEVNRISDEDAKLLVRNPIHCDYHPGNLKFEGGKVVGIFDFDWSKLDLRLFDVCLAFVYNSVQWGGSLDGTMYLDKCQTFLQSYQSTMVELGTLSPLNEAELRNFPVMMAMANFYVLNWDISDYYADNDRNDYEYLAYLKHNVRQMRWIESHKREFAELAGSVMLNN